MSKDIILPDGTHVSTNPETGAVEDRGIQLLTTIAQNQVATHKVIRDLVILTQNMFRVQVGADTRNLWKGRFLEADKQFAEQLAAAEEENRKLVDAALEEAEAEEDEGEQTVLPFPEVNLLEDDEVREEGHA